MYRVLLTLTLTLAVAASLPTLCPAQAKQAEPPPQAAVEPLGEGDPIPFMRTEPAAAPEEPSSAGLLVKTIASMAFIIGLIFLGAWGAKKLGYGTKAAGVADAAQLAVLTSVSLGNGRTVSAIQFADRILLVGSTPQSFTLLAEDDGPGQTHGRLVPRSVGELLAEDNPAFGDKLTQAETRIDNILAGGKLS